METHLNIEHCPTRVVCEPMDWFADARTGGSASASYDPKQDTWSPISGDTGVERRIFTEGHYEQPSFIWTGQEAIMWGGLATHFPRLRYAADGARYDPTTDTWSPISASEAPAGTDHHTAVWTGTEMLIWPGGDGAGGAYRPYWLTVQAPTQTNGIDDSPLFVAQTGELYRVVQFEGDWALVQALGDPPSHQEWVAVDDRVQLSTPYPPTVTGSGDRPPALARR